MVRNILNFPSVSVLMYSINTSMGSTVSHESSVLKKKPWTGQVNALYRCLLLIIFLKYREDKNDDRSSKRGWIDHLYCNLFLLRPCYRHKRTAILQIRVSLGSLHAFWIVKRTRRIVSTGNDERYLGSDPIRRQSEFVKSWSIDLSFRFRDIW